MTDTPTMVAVERLQHDGVWIRSAPMAPDVAERLCAQWRGKGWHHSRLRIVTVTSCVPSPVDVGSALRSAGEGAPTERSAEP